MKRAQSHKPQVSQPSPAAKPKARARPKSKTKQRKRTSYALIEKDYPGGRRVEFPHMKGRKLEKILMTTSSDYHAISLSFQDKTNLQLVIDPGFKIRAAFRDWKGGNGRDIKLWPPIESASLWIE